jgi:hypothetical protein
VRIFLAAAAVSLVAAPAAAEIHDGGRVEQMSDTGSGNIQIGH